MQNAGGIGGGETVGDTDQQLDHLPPRSFPGRCPVFERTALKILGDQVLPIFPFSSVMNRENVRVIERRSGLRFELKAAPGGGIPQIAGEKLDRDTAVEPGVLSTEHHTHSTLTQLGLEYVGTYLLAGIGWQLHDRRFQETLRLFVRRKQLFHIAAQRLIARAKLIEK